MSDTDRLKLAETVVHVCPSFLTCSFHIHVHAHVLVSVVVLLFIAGVLLELFLLSSGWASLFAN